jgi:peptidoglycan/xylan/chitin deacetylase (PgdA/CDA1 family)
MPSLKHLTLRAAQLCGLFALSRHLTRRHLRILCYHGIWLGPAPHYGDCLFMNAERFRRRMALLERRGYRVIPLAQGCRDLREGRIGARDVVITIDDAWAGTGEHMLPVLRAHGYPVTLYVTTEAVLSQQPLLHVLLAYMVERASRRAPALLPAGEPDPCEMSNAQLTERLNRRVANLPTAAEREAELRRIGGLLGVDAEPLTAGRTFRLMSADEITQASRDGVDIQLHTHTHRMPDFDPARIRAELARNHEALMGMLGNGKGPRVHFCYPGGVYHPSMFALLRDLGIESATTTEFGLNAPGANALALKRILDCESFSDLEFEARLSGFWAMLSTARAAFRRLMPGARGSATAAAG